MTGAQHEDGTEGQGDTAATADAGDVFGRLFGNDDKSEAKARARKRMAHATSVRKQKKAQARTKGARTQNRQRLRPAWLQFITEVIKTPTNQGAAYQRVYPKANEKTAWRRANELLNRPEIASEIERRQKIRASFAEISRSKMEGALTEFFQFDMRRFYYNDADEAAGRGTAGDAKKPHHLTLEEGQVLESYEKKVGKYGASIKFRTAGRLPSAELLAKLKGWVKDDGRPPIMATFNINLGDDHTAEKEVEAVPPALYGAMGLRTENQPMKPLPATEDADGNPIRSAMPPGYERGRGLRFGGKGRELAADFDSLEDAERD